MKWTWVKGYRGRYRVSTRGQVKSVTRTISITYGRVRSRTVQGRILKQSLNQGGYKVVTLSKNGKVATIPVHRLVACAFIPNPNNLPGVNHKDLNKENNRKSNLEWSTQLENITHFLKHRSKLTPQIIRKIRKERKLTQKEQAVKYGVTQATISRIFRNQSWRHFA